MTAARPRVLVVDDNQSAADAMVRVLSHRGYAAEAAYDGAAATARLDAGGVDVVLTDLKMAPVDGMAVLAHARRLPAPPEVLVFTGYGTVDAAVAALRAGARDFLTKPVSPEQIVARLEALGADGEGFPLQVGASPAAARLGAQIEAVAGVRSTVLLLGEPGSGHQLLAREIHRRGPTAAGPLTVLTHPGRARSAGAELAAADALFLPGVDHLDADDQRRLLRLLDSLGESGPRVIAAAGPAWSQPPEGAAGALYYRLAVLVVDIPPLRRRREDIPALLERLLLDRARALGRPPVTPTAPQLERLAGLSWPGNLRELVAVAERALVFGPGAFDAPGRSTPGAAGPPARLGEGFSLAQHLEAIERGLLLQAIAQAAGDRAAVARLLGLERNTLRYKLNKYGLIDRVR